jgi:hypothetical protein
VDTDPTPLKGYYAVMWGEQLSSQHNKALFSYFQFESAQHVLWSRAKRSGFEFRQGEDFFLNNAQIGSGPIQPPSQGLPGGGFPRK